MTAAADRARTISDNGPTVVKGALWSRTLSQIMCNSAAMAHSREKVEKAALPFPFTPRMSASTTSFFSGVTG